MESETESETDSLEAEIRKDYDRDKTSRLGGKKGEFHPFKYKDIARHNILDGEEPIFQLVPSKTGFNNITLDATLSPADKLIRLVEVAGAIKHDLETHMKKAGIDSQFLLKSVDKVIHIVDRYCNVSKPQPFNWTFGTFPPSVKKMSKKFVEDVDDIIWTSYENASKLSECDPALSDSACIPPSWNEIWREFKEFAKETLRISYPALFLSPCLCTMSTHTFTCMFVAYTSFHDKFRAFCQPEHQRINLKLVEELKSSIELDHPIVSVIGDFAVAAFNEACETHVKKGEHNNLHDFEIMECKYLKITNAFQFYMTIEAIEEGNLGVYETQVLCRSDGSRTLSKFILTDRNPAGTKAMAISLFSCVRSFNETLKHDVKEKEGKLGEMFEATMGPDHGTAWALLDLLDKVYVATMIGLHNVLSLGLRLLFSPDCNRTTNPDVWSRPDNYSISGMVPRRNATTCGGYHYCYGSRSLQTI